jgi:hypothetical protein
MKQDEKRRAWRITWQFRAFPAVAMAMPQKPALHLQSVWMMLEGRELALPPHEEHSPSVAPFDWATYLPAGQAVQAVLPGVAYVPSKQASQDDVDAVCFLPAAQGWRVCSS